MDAVPQTNNHRLNNFSTPHWDWLRSVIYIRDNGICWVCNKTVLLKDYDLGHLVDRCNSGADEIENCVVMHKQCNGGKPTHASLEEALLWKLRHNVSHQEPSQKKTKYRQGIKSQK
jgi:5-methylcytosine-specific restriction endonuclease McrA